MHDRSVVKYDINYNPLVKSTTYLFIFWFNMIFTNTFNFIFIFTYKIPLVYDLIILAIYIIKYFYSKKLLTYLKNLTGDNNEYWIFVSFLSENVSSLHVLLVLLLKLSFLIEVRILNLNNFYNFFFLLLIS